MSKVFDYTIQFDTKGLENQMMNDFGIGGIVQRQWDNILMRGIDPYVPFLRGVLAGSVIEASILGNGELIYTGPQAKRLYYNPEFNFTKDYHPLAGAYWAERASNDLKSFFVSELQRFIDNN